MGWTGDNIAVFSVGVVFVALGIILFRYRMPVQEFLLRQQTAMFGSWVGDKMRKGATPMRSVGIPAIGFVVMGTIFVLAGVFGHFQVS